MFRRDIKNNFEKIKKLIPNKHIRVLNVTHKGCMDGCGAQIMLDNVFTNLTSVECTYNNIDKTLRNIFLDDYDVVIITDIAPEHDDSVLDISNKFILIDHHQTAKRFYDPNKLRFVYDGQCGTMLTKIFLEEIFDTNLSYLNELSTLLNDYDMWHLQDSRSKQMNILFYSMWNQKFRKRFGSGNVNFGQEELDLFKQKEHEFNQVYNNIDFYDLESINATFIIADSFINDISHKALNEEGYNIIFIRNPINKNTSVRTNLENFDIGAFLFELEVGGGHAQSAGMKVLDNESLNATMMIVEKKLYERLPEIRKR